MFEGVCTISIKIDFMADAKTSCPKCGGHITFPKELAGQETSCPHCGESILLPKPKRAIAWAITSVAAISSARS